MKHSITAFTQRIALLFLLSLTQVLVWAQDSTGSSTNVTVTKESTTTTTTEWYTQPWVWVVGGAVFLIILVALLRGNSSSNKEVSRTTTVVKDRDYWWFQAWKSRFDLNRNGFSNSFFWSVTCSLPFFFRCRSPATCSLHLAVSKSISESQVSHPCLPVSMPFLYIIVIGNDRPGKIGPEYIRDI